MQQVASKTFLDHFDTNLRLTISNLYLKPVREGRARSALAVHAAVLGDLGDRRAKAFAGGWRETLEMVDAILATIHDPEADAIALGAWALEWEALAPEERVRQKGQRAAQHITAIMDRQAPTEKQVGFIRRQGFTDPIPSKAFASSLIDLLTRGYEVRRRSA